MVIKVTIDIFSGRPNPTWVLTLAQEAEYLHRLQALSVASFPDTSALPGLGYRGLISEMSKGLAPQETIRIYQGVIHGANHLYLDVERQFETWLLETAGSAVESSLIDIARQAIKQS